MAKTLAGIVTSAATAKTIVVTVRTRKTHPIYKKQYTVSTKFMAHDEKSEAKLGDQVIIVETRPISARKHFALQTITERAAIRHEEAVETEKSQDSKKKTIETEEVAEAPVKKVAKKAPAKEKKA